MTNEILISLIASSSAILVSLVTAFFSYRNSVILKNKTLKEEHYIQYLEALHNNAAQNSTESLNKYVFARDKLFIIASEKVISNLLNYEQIVNSNISDKHDFYLTELIKAIREDLFLKNNKLPILSLRKSSKF